MPKACDQKLKLIYLLKLFSEETDSEHGLSRKQIIEKMLNDYDIQIDRKTFYSDINVLNDMNHFSDDIEIKSIKDGHNRSVRYYLKDHMFSKAEIMLICSLIKSASFLSSRFADNLQHKLLKCLSGYQAEQIRYALDEVMPSDRYGISSQKASIEKITDAMLENKAVSFEYTVTGGSNNRISVSPWKMLIADGMFIMLGHDDNYGFRLFRIDWISSAYILEAARSGISDFDRLDNGRAFNGIFLDDADLSPIGIPFELFPVTFRFKKYLEYGFISRFGKDLRFLNDGDGYYTVKINVMINNAFFGWLMSKGPDVTVTGPEKVVIWIERQKKKMGISVWQYPVVTL